MIDNLPLDESARAVPHADVALVRSHLLHIHHVSHGEATGGVDTLKRSTSVVRDLVLVDEVVGLERITTIATTASDPEEVKIWVSFGNNITFVLNSTHFSLKFRSC